MSAWVVILVSLGYLVVLFLVAYFAESLRGDRKKLVNNPYIYALALAVYCTAWTYYGSVGRAVSTGVGFLPIYLGPTLMAPLWYMMLRKIITISKTQKITSIADFISARYGKNTFLGALVAFITVLGIIPYISLQLKAVSLSFDTLLAGNNISSQQVGPEAFYLDSAFYITIVLAVFAIFFGVRHLEANRRHEGLIAAIAFESVFKLIAFLAVGIFVTFFLYDGMGDIFHQAQANANLSKLVSLDESRLGPWNWFFLTLVSMFAVLLLPRQFHVAVVENSKPHHVNKAIWLFPLYLLVINIFVLPIAFGGYLHFGEGQVDADTYVLELPLAYGKNALALFVFLGGLSAATGMVIVATTALSIMLSNNLVLPILLRISPISESWANDLSSSLIGIRRLSIGIILLIAYGYFHLIGKNYALVSIGLISFVAVAQFAPSLLGGIYWKGGTRVGAILGLIAGFLTWAYTLTLPSMADLGVMSDAFIDNGLFGISFLKPYELFGITGMDEIAHATFWSLLFNTLFYVLGSLYSKPTILEQAQGNLFVDIYKFEMKGAEPKIVGSSASFTDIRLLLYRFLGERRARMLLGEYAQEHDLDLDSLLMADAGMINFVEKILAGAIGSASARLLISSIVKEAPLTIQEVMTVLDETQQLMTYSKALEQKSEALEKATLELQEANNQLQEMDRLKDEFITTVTHELRTPMTSIRSFSNILFSKENLDPERRKEFLSIIIKESERITRLINQVLDLEKMESGHAVWELVELDLREIVESAANNLQSWMKEKGVSFDMELPEEAVRVEGDFDRLLQVVVNLLSNAIKFSDEKAGIITLSITTKGKMCYLIVKDNGIGIENEDLPYIFKKFSQFSDYKSGRQQGSGLGLSISKQIVQHHNGTIRVESRGGEGSSFFVELPIFRNGSGKFPVSSSQF